MAEYRHSYEGVGQLLKSAQMQALMRSKGEKVLARAEATAPDGDSLPGDPDKYNESFELEVGLSKAGTRAAATVRNTSAHSIYVEHGNGTGKAPAHRTLGRALDSA